MRNHRTRARKWQQLGGCFRVVARLVPRPATAVTKMKFRGYITARVDDRTVAIMDDKLELTAASRIIGQDGAGEHAMTMAELGPGMLIEAEGPWRDRDKFFSEKSSGDLESGE